MLESEESSNLISGLWSSSLLFLMLDSGISAGM